jgi:hypothetical protein
MADGSIVFEHMNEDGTTYEVMRLYLSGAVADLGAVPGSGWLDVSPAGTIAFADGGELFLLAPGEKPRDLGAGEFPRVSPDGAGIAVYEPQTATERLLDLNGTVRLTLGSPFITFTLGEGTAQ